MYTQVMKIYLKIDFLYQIGIREIGKNAGINVLYLGDYFEGDHIDVDE